MTSIETQQDAPITWVRVMTDYSADPLWGRDGGMLEIGEVRMSRKRCVIPVGLLD